MQRLSLIVVAIACAAVTPASAGAGQASQSYEFTYTAIYCECTNGCPGFCVSPNASRVVTPFSETAGPADSSAAWSPDGAKVAYVSDGQIVVMDAGGTNDVAVAGWVSAAGGPAWSPDGARIAFASYHSGAPELYVMNPDGSGVLRVTAQVGFVSSRPTWAPDSRRLAFGCEVAPGNRDICVIDASGSGLVRLTADPAVDDGAAWSPDGATIAFSTARYGAGPQLATMREDGSNVMRLGAGIFGWEPAWSPDGALLAYTSGGSESVGIYVMRSGGTDIGFFGDFTIEPAWMPSNGLFPRMSIQCEQFSCTFDASGSLGPITGYSWSFGDGQTASGASVSHSYKEGGSYAVALTVSGENGAKAIGRDWVSLNRPPVASFAVACEGVSCIFDWSTSSDPEGAPLGVSWSFGDGGDSWFPVEGRPNAGRHVYPAPGTYTATIRVTDPLGEVATSSQTIAVTRGAMHVGDIDATSVIQQSGWSAVVTITMHDEGHRPLANAVVNASWNGATAVSCTTGAAGSCVLTRSKIPRNASVKLTVLGALNSTSFYAPAGNHDPDGGSNGTTIAISRQ